MIIALVGSSWKFHRWFFESLCHQNLYIVLSEMCNLKQSEFYTISWYRLCLPLARA